MGGFTKCALTAAAVFVAGVGLAADAGSLTPPPTPPSVPPDGFAGALCDVIYFQTGNSTANTTVTGKLVSLNDQGFVHLSKDTGPTTDILIPVGEVLLIDRVRIPTSKPASP